MYVCLPLWFITSFFTYIDWWILNTMTFWFPRYTGKESWISKMSLKSIDDIRFKFWLFSGFFLAKYFLSSNCKCLDLNPFPAWNVYCVTSNGGLSRNIWHHAMHVWYCFQYWQICATLFFCHLDQINEFDCGVTIQSSDIWAVIETRLSKY